MKMFLFAHLILADLSLVLKIKQFALGYSLLAAPAPFSLQNVAENSNC